MKVLLLLMGFALVLHLGATGGELSLAIRMQDAKALATALAAKADVNELDAGGLSPLFHAVVSRKMAVVKQLLDAGAQVAVAGEVQAPLWAATVNGDREIIALLLQKGADPAAGKDDFQPLVAAILSGRVPVLMQLLAAKPGLEVPLTVKRPVDFDKNLMFEAVTSRHPAMAARLLELTPGKFNPGLLEQTLILASAYQPEPALELIASLLKAGADPMARETGVTGPFSKLWASSGAEAAAPAACGCSRRTIWC